MKKHVTLILALSALMIFPSVISCSRNPKAREATTDSATTAQDSKDGPQLGQPGNGPVIDKSGDKQLQAMIKEVVPKFRQYSYTDSETGKTMRYNLFTPAGIEKGKKYPMVLFIADASTPGRDVTAPLTQGYGGLIWATAESQSKNPCYVLVPQFDGVAVNDSYRHTDEADIALRLALDVAAKQQVDTNQLYTTGQSMGGMVSMYYNVAYPDVFAASIFVDSPWATDTFAQLAKHKFVWFIAGDKGKAYPEMQAMEDACRKDGVAYSFAAWSAKLPEATQNSTAQVMLDKGAPVNIFQFEPGTVLPADGKGSEHLYSFDYAYRIASVRDWLFRQKK